MSYQLDYAAEATNYIEALLQFALENRLIDPLDVCYARNNLLEIMNLDAPNEVIDSVAIPETATTLLDNLSHLAFQMSTLDDDSSTVRELFETKLMGQLTPSPYEIRHKFQLLKNNQGIIAATDWFYTLCKKCNYIKVDAIAKNVRYFEDSPTGMLEITINLSKPEKDPREIAKLKNAPQVGYPKCMLCVENPGYRGRANFPARQNHRMIPLTLTGMPWHLQYSPYLYYNEHCIVINEQHLPMKIDVGTFQRLFEFVDQFPHYFIGSNADLPIVGGSILNHDHFQGGQYSFPMDHVEALRKLDCEDTTVDACILNWPMTAIALRSHDQCALINKGIQMLNAWRVYSDESLGVLAHTDAPHNTITPIARKVGNAYQLQLVLRNNNTSDEHPLGIYHPHEQLHHIKKENIGLIEVMGLFILPGRLLTELDELTLYLTGERELTRPDNSDPTEKHFDWVSRIAKTHGTVLTKENAIKILRKEMAGVCYEVLCDCGVYKHNEAGLAGVMRFLNTIGYQ